MELSNLKNILSVKGSALFYTPPKNKKQFSYLFKNPAVILTADDTQSFKKIITRAEELIKSGSSGYILTDYEEKISTDPDLNTINTSIPYIFTTVCGKL